MHRWFRSVRQTVWVVVSAAVTALSLVIDASGLGPNWAWQWLALGGFVAFAGVMLWRVHQLTGSPLHIEARWDSLQADLKPLIWGESSNGRVIFQATVSGRMWSVDPVVLDDIGVVFQRRLWGRLPFLHRDICVGRVGESSVAAPGKISGTELKAGQQFEWTKQLFSEVATHTHAPGRVEAKFVVRLRAPDQEYRAAIRRP